MLPNEGHLLVADPDGGAIPLLADFFGADNLESSEAWTSGESVAHDAPSTPPSQSPSGRSRTAP